MGTQGPRVNPPRPHSRLVVELRAQEDSVSLCCAFEASGQAQLPDEMEIITSTCVCVVVCVCVCTYVHNKHTHVYVFPL